MTDKEIARRLWREDPEDSFWLELLAALAAARADEREKLEKECADIDDALSVLGIECRTEGGALNVPKIRAAIRALTGDGK